MEHAKLALIVLAIEVKQVTDLGIHNPTKCKRLVLNDQVNSSLSEFSDSIDIDPLVFDQILKKSLAIGAALVEVYNQVMKQRHSVFCGGRARQFGSCTQHL